MNHRGIARRRPRTPGWLTGGRSLAPPIHLRFRLGRSDTPLSLPTFAAIPSTVAVSLLTLPDDFVLALVFALFFFSPPFTSPSLLCSSVLLSPPAPVIAALTAMLGAICVGLPRFFSSRTSQRPSRAFPMFLPAIFSCVHFRTVCPSFLQTFALKPFSRLLVVFLN